MRPLVALACLLAVAAAMFSLWIGLSGLMVSDPPGGIIRILGGFVGFFAVFFVTLAMMQRS